ncbi:HEAT repeat domain-containing protein [Candidatus Poribacteria bacterium]|nr:HEAT repeat domain-containing protein [Candidatus Poribacteria bacterium]
MISELEYSSLNLLVDFILISKPTSEGQLLFQILCKLRKKDLHRYIITFQQEKRPTLLQRQTLVRWLERLGIINEYIQALIKMPISEDLNPNPTPNSTTIALGKALMSLDATFAERIAKFVKKSPASDSINGLTILEAIAEENTAITQLLAPMVNHPDPRVRSQAVKTVGKLSADLMVCRQALRDKDGRVRANAIELLWSIESPKLRKLLLPYLKDPYNRVRANAARIFYDAGDPRGLETLVTMIDSDDENCQASSMWILGEVQDTNNIDRLEVLTQTKSKTIRQHAFAALQKIESIADPIKDSLILAREMIFSAPDSGLPADKQYIALLASLRSIQGEETYNMLRAIHEASPRACQEMLCLLKSQGETSENLALVFLVAASFCRDDRIRSKAARLVGRVCKQEGVFRYFLNDPDPRVRANAIEGLAEQQEPFVTSLLSQSLTSLNHRVVVNAAKALYERNHQRGMKILMEHLHDENLDFRVSCLWALGEIGDETAESILKELNSDPDPGVQNLVSTTLEKIRARRITTIDI